MAAITGWGRQAWGDGPWGEPVPVELTGQSATGAVGTVAITAEANFVPNGQRLLPH